MAQQQLFCRVLLPGFTQKSTHHSCIVPIKRFIRIQIHIWCWISKTSMLIFEIVYIYIYILIQFNSSKFWYFLFLFEIKILSFSEFLISGIIIIIHWYHHPGCYSHNVSVIVLSAHLYVSAIIGILKEEMT